MKITYLKKGKLKKIEEISGTVRWKAKIAGYFAVGIKFNETISKKTHPLMSQCL